MNREKSAWIVSIILVALLAFDMPATVAQRDNDYAFVRTLVDIQRQVVNNYVVPVDQQKLETAAIDGMLAQLDPYSNYVPPDKQEGFALQLEGNFKGVGIQIMQHDDGAIRIVSPIDGSPAYRAGVQAGDLLLKVDGTPIVGLKINDAALKIKGKIGTEVTLTVRHTSGQEVDLTMTRQEIELPTLLGFDRNTDNSWNYFVSTEPRIAYVRLTQFTPDSFKKLHMLVSSLHDQGMGGLILDLRWNPGGLLDEAQKVVDMFVPAGTVIVKTSGRARPEVVYTAGNDNKEPYFPMVVLVNGFSASAAEIVSGSLQDNKRAVIVGSRSFGKGSVQEIMQLDGDSGQLKLTVAHYFLPSGRLVHKLKDAKDWGVNPDIQVLMDKDLEEKVRAQLDEQQLPYHLIKPATQTAGAPATQAATQPAVDLQLQAAENQLIGYIITQKRREAGGEAAGPMTAPTHADTQPIEPPATVD